MDCICGCGTKIPAGQIETNLTASTVALELLAWDKARAISQIPTDRREETDELIERGAEVYQALLSALHGEGKGEERAAGDAWLAEALPARPPGMTTGRGFFTPSKLHLTDEDTEGLNRLHPEQSFSAQSGSDPVPEERATEDPVEQLRGLRELHAAGALTDEEFAEAKARVIGRI